MARPGLVLCITMLLALAGCGEDPAPPEVEPPAPGPVVVPMPAPKPRSLDEEARGLYVYAGGGVRMSLDLQSGRVFRIHSTREGGPSRNGSGTWRITPRGLLLTYEMLNGEPLPDGPQTVANKWRGRTIELKETGLPRTIVLVKRSVIRQR